jgi:hypothetical protein
MTQRLQTIWDRLLAWLPYIVLVVGAIAAVGAAMADNTRQNTRLDALEMSDGRKAESLAEIKADIRWLREWASKR